MSDPVRLATILHNICACGAPATVRYTAGRHGDDYRAAQACARHAPAARRWVQGAARAGPLRETRLAANQPPKAEQEVASTLF